MLPEAGREDVAQADSTPGILPSFGMSVLKKRPASSCLNCVGGKPTRNVRVFDESIPMSVPCSLRKLRNIKPAPPATPAQALLPPQQARCARVDLYRRRVR